MTTGAHARLARVGVGVLAVIAAGGALTACGASAEDLAKASCVHVTASLKLFEQAKHTTDPTTATALQQKAYLQLIEAVPIAAQAAYHDVQWEALSTTLSEANRVPESELIPSLQTQCQAADTSVFDQPPPPSSSAGG